MKLTIKTCALVFALGLAPLAAVAQTATEETEGASTEVEAEPTTEGTAPGSDLSTGVAENADGIGQTYVRDNYQDWQLRCIKTTDGNDPCQLYQLLVDGDGNSVAEINLFLVHGNPAICQNTICS